MKKKITFSVRQTGELNTFKVKVEQGAANNPGQAAENLKHLEALTSIKAEPFDRMAQYLANMDFKLLKQQKTTLLNLQAKLEKDSKYTQKEWNVIEGMINFVDSIQDIAVDEYGYEEKKVFKLSRKDK